MSSIISPPQENGVTGEGLRRPADIDQKPTAPPQRRRHFSRQALFSAAAVAALSFLGGSLPGGADAAALSAQIRAGSPLAIRGGGIFGRGAAPEGASAALRAMQGTVQAQAKQLQSQADKIEALKRQLADGPKKSKASAGGHGAHGGGGAVEGDLQDYLDESFYHLAYDRVGWLGLFLASLSLTAVIMSGFEHTLSRQIELAYFVPLLVGHGGNAGGQTVGTVLAAMSSGVVGSKDAARIVAKEAGAGLSAGLVLGAMVAIVSRFAMGISAHVSVAIMFTIPLVNVIAAVLASALPFLCVAMGLDPLDIAAPAMTTLVDVTGLLGYFLIARAVFEAFGLEL